MGGAIKFLTWLSLTLDRGGLHMKIKWTKQLFIVILTIANVTASSKAASLESSSNNEDSGIETQYRKEYYRQYGVTPQSVAETVNLEVNVPFDSKPASVGERLQPQFLRWASHWRP
jgi:hypothetical protein